MILLHFNVENGVSFACFIHLLKWFKGVVEEIFGQDFNFRLEIVFQSVLCGVGEGKDHQTAKCFLCHLLRK